MVRSGSKLQGLYTELRQKIVSHELVEGDRLPTTNELSKLYGCSVNMASKAIAMLIHDRLVEQRRGLGTRVLKSPSANEHPSVELNAFAFIYPSDKHESISRMVGGFQDAARDAGRRTITLTTGSDYRREAELFNRLPELDVKGAVVYPSLLTRADHVHFTQMLFDTKLPVVLTVNFPGLGYPAVVIDGFHAAYTMTKHLVSRGAKRIGFLTNQAWSFTMRDRYFGYCWAMEESGQQVPQNGVLLEPEMHPDFENPADEPTEIGRRFLQKNSRLDAVVCANDFIALGLLAAAKEFKIRVPRDLMITGIDDLAVAASAEVPLTTYHGAFETRGRVAFDTLVAVIQGSSPDYNEIRIRGELVQRKSA